MFLQELYFLLQNGILIQLSVWNYPNFIVFSHKCRKHMIFDNRNRIFMNIFKIFFTLQILFTVWNLNDLFNASMFKDSKLLTMLFVTVFLRSRNSLSGTNLEPLIFVSMLFLFWPKWFSLMTCSEIMQIYGDCILISSR